MEEKLAIASGIEHNHAFEQRYESETQAYRELVLDLQRYFRQHLLRLLGRSSNLNYIHSAFNEILQNWPLVVAHINTPQFEQIFADKATSAAARQAYYDTSQYLMTQLATLLGEKLLIDAEGLEQTQGIKEFIKHNNGLKQIEFSAAKGELMPYTEELLMQVLAGSRERLKQQDNEREFIEVRNQEILLQLLRGVNHRLQEGDMLVEYSPPYYEHQPGTMVRAHIYRAGKPPRFETTQWQIPHLVEDDQSFYPKLLELQNSGVEIKQYAAHKEELEPANELLARPLLLRGATLDQIRHSLVALSGVSDNLDWINEHDQLVQQTKSQIFSSLEPLTQNILASLSSVHGPANLDAIANNLHTSISFAEVSVLPQSVLSEQNPHLSSDQISEIKRVSGTLISSAATDAESATQDLRTGLGSGISFSYQSGSDCSTTTLELPSRPADRESSKPLTQELRYVDADGNFTESKIGYYTDSKEWICPCGNVVDTCHVSADYHCSKCGVPLGKIKKIYADDSITAKDKAINALLSDHHRQPPTKETTSLRFATFMEEMVAAITGFFFPFSFYKDEEI
jgi:hypothetical protein